MFAQRLFIGQRWCCFALLAWPTSSLAQDARRPPAPPPPRVKVEFKNRQSAWVVGPSPTFDEVGGQWTQWSAGSVYPSPDQKFAAVLFTWAFAKYASATVQLVSDQGRVMTLPQSQVNQLFWTKDSRFIVGLGRTTLRLWTTTGQLNTMSMALPGRHQLVGNGLCLAQTDPAGDVVVRYRFPDLKVLWSKRKADDAYASDQDLFQQCVASGHR